MSIESTNPATGETVETYEEDSSADRDEALERAEAVFDEWREVPIEDRQEMLARAGEQLRENESTYAELMTEEMGKPIAQSHAEVEKCAWLCDYYAEHAAEHLQDDRIASESDARTLVSYEPIGTVLAIMPWNFPFWQAFRFAVPNLAAGNVGILKHASNVPGCARAIEEVFREAGCPEGAFTSLLIGSEEIDEVIADDRIEAVTLTGSSGAGRSVAETAGSELKKTVLELGGSDPFVVLDDADLELAVEKGTQARLINSGQSCIAAKRFIVVEDVYDEFLEAFVERMDEQVVGDPTDEDTDVGPQAREDLMETLDEQVQETVEQGAECHVGGEPMDREGAFYPPTVLTDIPEGSPADREELFGPAASVFRVPDEEAAIEKANDTQFGLGASVWTEDYARGERVARRFESGMAFVNELVKSDPRLPFGGVKASGYGRELAEQGIREFVNEKTIWVQHQNGEDDGLVE
ncbi:NAD-dependent succinate-semialdehyde dehydrogenase [Halostagnicola kamekurae]|uniref:Succinate-semialdehyde dehydrogenase / glutarate-semialdehyde dehydrogenase n=1 Tax=Halostagnicola kamekurae TaxID=619731 RepID=A0A1I6SIB1_9EURY|nr:NAD-dependent succinate-semialdehyde dehydrogenase [Halostagnicola kamekurae]SFS76705.1 succinate-semialdehyde dehydrogenase / glutarate-semialdehyde dehydrogenase [Halostagnicola kamekurae]